MISLIYLQKNIKRYLQYKLDFFLVCFAVAPISLVYLLITWIISDRFGGIGGWSFWEMSLLYSLLMVSYSIAQVFFRHFRYLDQFIIQGNLDYYFIQPLSIIYNHIFSHLNLMEVVAQFIPSIIILIITCLNISIKWNVWKIIYLLGTICAGTTIQASYFVLIGLISFWTVRSRSLEPLYFSFHGFLNYPIAIYSKEIVAFLTFLLPLGFINYPELFMSK